MIALLYVLSFMPVAVIVGWHAILWFDNKFDPDGFGQ